MELRPRVGDLFGFYEIILRKDYFSAGQVLRPGDTVIDVGANIGCFAILAAQMVGPSGRVFAIEPDASTFEQLVRNVHINEITNIVPLKMAVGATRGSTQLHSASNRLFSSIYSSVNSQPIKGIDQEVEVTTIAQLMIEHNIASCEYLKLDCEGAEHDIVQTLTPEIAGRILQITLELHKVPGHDGAVLGRRLSDLGFGRMGTSTLPFYRR
jgi:FkbM family methyltransferase